MTPIVLYLQVGRKCHVDLLPTWSNTVQQQGIMHGAIPSGLKSEKGPEGGQERLYIDMFNLSY